MKNRLNEILKPHFLVAVFFMLAGCLVLEIIIHECGHMVTTWILGGKTTRIVFFGFQLYPGIDFSKWEGLKASVPFEGIQSNWEAGLILFMGAGTATIVAYLLLLVPAIHRKTRKWTCAFLIILSIGCAWDIITYTLLPLFGLPNRLVVGRVFAEPLAGSELMGMPKTYVVIAVVLHFALYHVLLAIMLVKIYKAILRCEANHSIQAPLTRA